MLQRGFLVLLFIFFSLAKADDIFAAGDFSYVYIQGDKETPFYVKLDDIMLPRYGKNYYIIPQLAPGTINIQILFQQNKYPPHTFTIKVPENGFRGFLLTKKSGAYTLFDIQQNFYLNSGNTLDDDNAPEAKAYVYKAPVTNTPVAEPKPKPTVIQPKDDGPKFIDMELNNTRSVDNTQGNDMSGIKDTPPTVVNSDCPEPIDENDLENLIDKTSKRDDHDRLKYLLSKMDNCYSTVQAGRLARLLNSDPARYTFLKRVYPRITNQNAFPALEALLSGDDWKNYFRLIIAN